MQVYEPEPDDQRGAVKAVLRVANAFALPDDDAQLSWVVSVLMERYGADEIYQASLDMPFDTMLAEKLRYTRGLTVTDFSSRIEEHRKQKAESYSEARDRLYRIMRRSEKDLGNKDLLERYNDIYPEDEMDIALLEELLT